MTTEPQGKIEFMKFFLRLGEITFTVLIATPAALLILRPEISLGKYLVSLGIGFGAMLLFFLVAYTMGKR